MYAGILLGNTRALLQNTTFGTIENWFQVLKNVNERVLIIELIVQFIIMYQ